MATWYLGVLIYPSHTVSKVAAFDGVLIRPSPSVAFDGVLIRPSSFGTARHRGGHPRAMTKLRPWRTADEGRRWHEAERAVHLTTLLLEAVDEHPNGTPLADALIPRAQ